MNILEMPKDYKPKSFWERKEGTTGMLFGIPLIGFGLYALYHALPYIITLLQNTITAVFLGSVLFVAFWVLTDKRFLNLAWYFYKSIMRGITRVFVEIDPIGILKSYISELQRNATEMRRQMGLLSGQIKILGETIAKNDSDRAKNLQLAHLAKQNGKNAQLVVKSRQAGRLKESNITLEALKKKLEILLHVFSKMHEACEVSIEDLDNEVNVREREYKAIQTAYSIFKTAVKIINGDQDKKEVFQQTMEFLAENYGNKLGEIEEFMSASKGFIEGIDLQNMAYEEDSLKELEMWEQKTDSLLLGDSKQDIVEGYQVFEMPAVPLTVPLSTKQTDYAELIK